LMVYRLPLGVSAAGAYTRAVLDEAGTGAIGAE
jgi:hypothetical protein